MIAVSETQSPDDISPLVGACLLGSIDNEIAQRRAATVAHALACARNTDLLVDNTAPVADETEVTSTPLPDSHREAHCRSTRPMHIGDNLQPIVSQHQPSGVVLERGKDASFLTELWADTAERLASETDVLTVGSRGEIETIASMLVPVAGGQHSQLAAEAAHAIAVANDAAVDLFHVIESDSDEAREDGQRVLDEMVATLDDPERVDTWLFEAPNTAEAIIEQSTYYDLTVMGAPTVGPLKRFVFGSLSKRVQRGADSPVVVAHSHSE